MQLRLHSLLCSVAAFASTPMRRAQSGGRSAPLWERPRAPRDPGCVGDEDLGQPRRSLT